MKSKYINPLSLEEFQNEDKYQILILTNWSSEFTYYTNTCESKKEYIRYLIERKRIRIKRNE